MKNVKYKLIDTLLYDYSLIEEKLTKLATEGWHLEKIGTLGWKFRRGEPKQVRYAVTYAPSASAFNSRPTEAEEDLSDLCAQGAGFGWRTRRSSMSTATMTPTLSPWRPTKTSG